MRQSSVLTEFELEMAMAHIPVLTTELLEVLDVATDSRVVDCTFGGGGHAAAVCSRLGAEGLLIAADRDPLAYEYYDDLKQSQSCRTAFYEGNFADVLAELRAGGEAVTHVYMDLGVSSMQIDTIDRGFSYTYDAPLDMRMDPSARLTAAIIVNEWEERRLATLFREYGEERYARGIARGIVRRRSTRPLERTLELVDVIKSAIPTPARFGARNPAMRVFQALRIAVNDELSSLTRALPEAYGLLESGGVMAVISFHSLEDRIVKEFFVSHAKGCVCPPGFPVCACGKKPDIEILTSRPITPGEEELQANPRAGSAKLRAARKL